MTEPAAAQTLAWLMAELAGELKVDARALDPARRFQELGLDSARAVSWVARLSERLGRPLSPTLVWELPTPESLARHLVGDDATVSETAAAARGGGTAEPIAVVGLACRLPGAEDPSAFWRLLTRGVDAVGDVPASRWEIDDLYDPDPRAAGKMNAREGGFLEAIDRFDAAFFGLSPREARQLDPQQRLLLELAWEALEDAGLPPQDLRGSRTGVFVGTRESEYARLVELSAIDLHTATGQDVSVLSGRVSYTFGLEGPSLTLNTACSSSLVAVHLACHSLARGESDLALAGGVQLMLHPWGTVALSKFGGLAPDGRCKAFDARADGFGRGEGGGLVVLKRLSRALADGDPVYCRIEASAVNNDGFSNGLSAPSAAAQKALLRDAYARAGIDGAAVGYVEAHGTGTALGDPIEAEALGAVLGAGRAADRPLYIGSVKSNLGHLESAAGVAGLIKTALALRHRRLPPSLHFETPNPYIPFGDLGLKVQGALEPWPRPEKTAVAGVNAFGFSGTNCHLVLSAPPDPGPPRLRSPASADEARRRVVFVFSGNGCQWPGMARELLAEPVFHHRVARCDRAFRRLTSFSLLELLSAPEGSPTAERLLDGAKMGDEAGQLALFAVQLGLVDLWRSWGVVPDAVIGHSDAEAAAAHVAGALDLDAAARVIYHCARVQTRLAGHGGMLLVTRSRAEVEEDLAALEAGGIAGAGIAAVNSPRSIVVSGPPDALAALAEGWAQGGVQCRPIKVDIAAHGVQIEALREELTAALADLRPRAASVPIVSATDADWAEGTAFDGAYWARNLRHPVLFAPATEKLVSGGYDVFLEVSPHPVLARPLAETLDGRGRVLTCIRRGEPAHVSLFATAEAFAELGWEIRARSGAGPDFCEPSGSTASEPVPEDEGTELVPFSARSPAALVELADATRDFLASRPDVSLREIAHQRAVRRGHLEYRLAIVTGGRQELERRLGAFVAGDASVAPEPGRRVPGRPPKMAWVFAGQGGQWAGMGRRLLDAVPEFRRRLTECDAAIGRQLEPARAWSVLDEIRNGPRPDIDVVQPVLFALQVALAGTLRSWGLEPAGVVGQSMGEVAAACVAGALDLDDAAAVICRRSRLLHGTRGRGAMLATECTPEQAVELLVGEEDQVAVAAVSGPRATVLSGAEPALARIVARLDELGIYHRPIQVDVASHSPQMEPLLPGIRAALESIRPRAAPVPFYSTVTERTLDGHELDADYWARNLRRPVQLWSAVQRLATGGFDTFVEIGPHPVLVPALEGALGELGHDATVRGSLQRDQDDRTALHRALATLYHAGCDFDWRRLQPSAGRHLRLPLYPWQRERFWIEGPEVPASHEARRPLGGPHRYVGAAVESSLDPGTRFWQGELRLSDFPELADHRIALEPAVPRSSEWTVLMAASYQLDLVSSAARELAGGEPFAVEEMSFLEPLILEAEGSRQLQLATRADGSGWSFQIATRSGDSWAVHATGRLARRVPESIEEMGIPETGEVWSAEEHVAALTLRGIDCGRSLWSIRSLRRAGQHVRADVRLPRDHPLGPALLDVGFQLVVAALPRENDDAPGFAIDGWSAGDAYLGKGVDRLWWRPDAVEPGQQLRAESRLREAASGDDGFVGEVTVRDESGRIVLRGEGLRLQRIVPAARRRTSDLLYEEDWRHRDLPVSAGSSGPSGSWLLIADRGGVAERLEQVLRTAGGVCRLLSADGEELRAALAEQCRGVVDLRGLDVVAEKNPFSESAARRGWRGVLALIQSLAASGEESDGAETPRLWVVTRHACSVKDADVPSLASSMVTGLLPVAMAEHPELRPSVIDLGDVDEQELVGLVRELFADGVEDRVALRGARRYLPRPSRIELSVSTDEAASPSGTWLITGGLGALGLAVARDLAAQGVRHLLLLGRSAPTDAARVVLAELESTGVEACTAQVDVSDARALATVLDESKDRQPPLRGVVHAASVIDDDRLAGLDPERFRAVLAPKAVGAWNLHRLTRDQPLDAFVLFSSVASVLGLPGQGSYAAANAFLDALAHHRRRSGLPAVSVDWPGWAGLGFAVTEGGRGILGYLDRRGITELAGAQGLAILRRVLRAERAPAQVMVLPVAEERLGEHRRHGRLSPFWAALSSKVSCGEWSGGHEDDAAGVDDRARGVELKAELEALPPGPRRKGLLEQRLQAAVAGVLGLEPEQVDRHRPWRELGLQSLMAIELRGRLEALTGLTLSTTLVWRKPSLRELVPFLAERMGVSLEAPTEPAGEEAELLALVAEIEELSEEESQRLLG